MFASGYNVFTSGKPYFQKAIFKFHLSLPVKYSHSSTWSAFHGGKLRPDIVLTTTENNFDWLKQSHQKQLKAIKALALTDSGIVPPDLMMSLIMVRTWRFGNHTAIKKTALCPRLKYVPLISLHWTFILFSCCSVTRVRNCTSKVHYIVRQPWAEVQMQFLSMFKVDWSCGQIRVNIGCFFARWGSKNVFNSYSEMFTCCHLSAFGFSELWTGLTRFCVKSTSAKCEINTT